MSLYRTDRVYPDVTKAHLDLLAWFDARWPDPRDAPEVLRVSTPLYDEIVSGLEQVFRFCDPMLAGAGLKTIRLRPFGCLTNLVADAAAAEPCPDTIANAVASARAA